MFEILKSKQIQYFLVLAILLRLLLMPFFYHPDIKTYHFQVSFLQNGVWDIYTYLTTNKAHLSLKEDFTYFPLTYFFLGGYQILISPLLGDNFMSWVGNASESAIENVGVYRYLFLLKLPYLVADVAMAFLLTLFFIDLNKKKEVLIIWLFNPISILLIYLFSNFDVLTVLMAMISLLLLKQNKIILSGVFLGIAAGFKVYPLIFLPFYFIYANNIKQKLLIVFSSLGTFGLIVLPYLNSAAFRESTLTSGIANRIISGGLDIKFGESLLPGVVGIGLLMFVFYDIKNKTNEKLWQLLLSVLLIVYSSIHFHIQWLLWSMPLAILVVIQNRELQKLYFVLLLIAIMIPLLYQDKYMSVGLYAAVSPLYNLLPLPFTVLEKFYTPYAMQSILHSLFLAGSIYLIYKLHKRI